MIYQMFHVDMETNVGRKPIPNTWRHVCSNGKQYSIGTITLQNGTTKTFVIDKDDFEKVSKYNWATISSGYACTHVKNEEGRRKYQLLLHNLIMNRLTPPGKGAKESVDHINRNGMDNRKENLRIVSQSQQNLNQSTKERIYMELPEGCGITEEEVPRHIWYIKAHGLHGDRFGIDFKTEGIKWKTTSSKKKSLREKLNEAIQKLHEYYSQYPYLNPSTYEKQQKALLESLDSIYISQESIHSE